MLMSKRKFDLKKRIEDKLWRKYLTEINKKDIFHSRELEILRNIYANRINELTKFQESELIAYKDFYNKEIEKIDKARELESINLKKAQDRELLIQKNQYENDLKSATALANLTTVRAENKIIELENKIKDADDKETKFMNKLKMTEVQVAEFKEKRKSLLRDVASMLDIENHLDNMRY